MIYKRIQFAFESFQLKKRPNPPVTKPQPSKKKLRSKKSLMSKISNLITYFSKTSTNYETV